MLLQALLLFFHPMETETYLYKGKCARTQQPMDNCPEGFNLSVQLTSIGLDYSGRSPFNVPRDFWVTYSNMKKCWQLDLECSERFIRVTVICNCSSLGSGLLPLRNASNEAWPSTSTVKWQLHHIDTKLKATPENDTSLELRGCYDHGNGSYSLGSMYGTDKFAEAPERKHLTQESYGGNCNYINEMVFSREPARSRVVLIVVFIALMVGLMVAVLWSS